MRFTAAISVLVLVVLPAALAYQPQCTQTSTTNDLLLSIVGNSQVVAPPLGAGTGMAYKAADETCKTVTDKFMYNLQYGPPNKYRSLTGSNRPTTATAFSALWWTANITCSAKFVNGFPLGCCGNTPGFSGTNAPIISACKLCLNNADLPTTFPTYYNGPTTASANTVGSKGQVSTEASFKPIIQPWQPLTGASSVGLAPSQITIGGTGVNTLLFPATSGATMAAGVYTFQLWAESLCGKAKSKEVNLAARCPPPPVIRVVVRSTAWAAPIATEGAGAAAYIPATTNVPLFIDASCSMPYQQQKGPSASWAASTTKYSNLYAIQTVSFSSSSTTETSFSAFVNSGSKTAPSGGWGDRQTFSVTSPAGRASGYQMPSTATTPYNAWPFGAWVRVGTSTSQTVYVTVSDGCSASQTSITIKAECSCKPSAQAAYMPTVWTNQMTATGSASAMNNHNGGTGAANVLAFKLSASLSTDLQGPTNGDLSYDWSFFSWAPDYSDPVGTGGAAYYSVFQANGGKFPPSAAAACANPQTGEQPLACTAGAWGLTSNNCCFSRNDISWDIGMLARPTAANSYKYAIIQSVFQNGAQASWTATQMAAQINNTDIRKWVSGTTRENVYSFMRIAGACVAPNASGAALPWTTVNTTSVIVGNNQTRYHALPQFLQSGQNGGQNFNDIPELDFNNFPNVAPGQTAKPTVFRPTTQCSGWLRQTIMIQRMTTLQMAHNYTRACSGEKDLLLCQITITTTQLGGSTNRWNQPDSFLRVSSFGSCKGQWQFQLAVNDQCSTGYDYFDLKVGCNRAPSVVPGCSNTQTWVGSAGGNRFDQITLDGRASWDADNFGDSFYGIASRTDAFPDCTTCQNGGLGTYGLTYAWAFKSAPGNSLGTTVGSACPVTAASMMAACDQDAYCSGTPDFSYPTIDLKTNKWNAPASWPGRQTGRTPNAVINNPVNNQIYGPSTQGGANLFLGWGSAQQPATTISGTTYWNRLPAIDRIASTASANAAYWSATSTVAGVTDLPLFPLFRADCAPTQMPMFIKTTTQTGAKTGSAIFRLFNDQVQNAQNLWQIYQQLQHQGNVAYIQGLTLAGDYTVRLYAFDGCSVGYGDVSFTTTCPTIQFSDINKFPTFLAALRPEYMNGNSSQTRSIVFPYTNANPITPGEFTVPYDGVPSASLSGSATVYSCAKNSTGTFCLTAVRSCSIAQKPGSAIFSDVRTMIAHKTGDINSACTALIYDASTGGAGWLPPNEPEGYRLVVTITDGCSNKVYPINYDFKVKCQNKVEVKSEYAQNANASSWAQFQLGYTFPSSASRTANPTGKFSDVPMHLQAQGYSLSGSGAQTPVTNGIVWTFAVRWNNQVAASNTFTNAQSKFPTSAAVASGTVDTNPLVGYMYAASTPGIAVGSLVAGTRTIQFPAVTPAQSFLSWGYLPAANAMANGPITAAPKNVVLHAAQSAFGCAAGTFTANCRQNPFMWHGTYKITATATLRGNGQTGAISNLPYSNANFGQLISCAVSTPVDWYVTLSCGALPDPTPSVMVTCLTGSSCNSVGTFTGTSLTTPPTTATGGVAPKAQEGVDVAFQLTTATYCANGIQASAYTPYCNTPHGPSATGNVKTGAWPTMYFSAPGWAGWAQTGAGNDVFSTLSFVPSYKNPVTIGLNCSGQPGTPAPNCNGAPSWDAVNQNPLALSPTAYANIPKMTGTAATTFAYPVTNKALTSIVLGLPGTWQIDLYGTNGCANTTTSATTGQTTPGFEMHYYCYRNDMPNADMTVKVRDFRENEITGREMACTGANAPVAVGQVGTAGPWRARRRLLMNEEDDTKATKVSVRATNAQGQSTACGLNTGLNLVSGTLNFPRAGGGNLPVSSAPGMNPNFQSYVPIYFNSYAISPGYQQSTVVGDVRNFNGMGTVFPNSALKYGLTNPEPFNYQGNFENIRFELKSQFNVKATAWFGFGNNEWSSMYACGSGGSCLASQTIPTQTSGTAYSTFCALTKVSEIYTQTSLYTGTAWPPAAGATTVVGNNVNFKVYGCNSLGQGMTLKGNPLPNTRGTAALVEPKFDAQCTCQTWDAATPSNRDCSNCQGNTALANAANSNPSVSYFTASAAPSGAVKLGGGAGMVSSKAGIKDFVLFVWNGPIGASCYDYRAIRVEARCNMLTGSGSDASPSMMVNGAAIAQGATTPTAVTWQGTKFPTVELSAGIQYYQCGQYGTTECGSSTSGAASTPGNLYSLVYRWHVVDSPANSWYGMYNMGVSTFMGSTTWGQPMPQGSAVQLGDLYRMTYHRSNTQLVNTTTNTVVLVNHGFNTPKTCLRPDVEGTYKVQLQIDDGCAVWQGQVVSVSAACPAPAAASAVIGGINIYTASLKAATARPQADSSNTFSLTVVGNVFERVTLQSTVKPSVATDYYTYSWSIISPYTGSAMKMTNSQGNVVSFVPEQTPDKMSGYQNMAPTLYNVTLSISSNCWKSTGMRDKTDYTFQVSIACDTTLDETVFQFGNTKVQTWSSTSSTQKNKWWLVDSGAGANSGSIDPSTYYNAMYTVPPPATTTLATASCSTTGPFCGPSSTVATGGIPTILYGGSAYDTTNYASAGWQGYYFAVPATLNPRKAQCKVLRTYWMLTGYQNSVNFYPTYTPSPTTVVANVSCFPEQKWRLTIKKTPCEPCGTTGAQGIQDVCTFVGYNTYWMKNDALTNTVVSAYTPPSFVTTHSTSTPVLIGTASVLYTAPGATSAVTKVIPGGGRCIWGTGSYTGGVTTSYTGRLANLEPTVQGMTPYVHNCLVSGRGREIDVLVGTKPSSYTCNPAASSTRNCYMSEINFVPAFPGEYTLQFSITDSCGAPVTEDIVISARCATVPIKPKLLKQDIVSYYYCQETGKPWGSAARKNTGSTQVPGAFEPQLLSAMIETPDYLTVSKFRPEDKVNSGTGSGVPAPAASKKCAVTSTTSTVKNCTDVRNQLKNDAALIVDTSSSNGDKFKACCTCLYGQNTINVFSVPGSGTSTRRDKVTPDTSGTHNVLALSDSQYSSNWNLLIGLVAPLAVILVLSVAGNILMVLKLRQAGGGGGSYNVRAGDVELSTSPRARVDV